MSRRTGVDTVALRVHGVAVARTVRAARKGHNVTKWQDEHGIPVDDRGRHDAALIDWRELDAVPTLHQSYTANLKIETDDERVWLERTTTADGEHCDHHITVERLRAGRWETTSEN